MNDGGFVAALNLVKSYAANKVNAVDDISFDVQKGQVFGLLGPNGAGKTTTIKMMLGLVEPTSGSAFLAGQNVGTHRSQAVANVGAILEGSRNIYWRLSARSNLAYFGRLRGLTGKRLKTRTEVVLNIVGMADRADEETRYLSRGMQQKIAFAIALLHDPAVLILDEPTLGLDVNAAKVVEQVILDQALAGKAVILTTHQMALAQKVCDQIAVINNGKIVTKGSNRDILNYFGDEQQTVQLVLDGVISDSVLAGIRDTQPEIEAQVVDDQTELSWSSKGLTQADLLVLMRNLDSQGIVVRQFGLRKATLEEVFVKLTAGPTDSL